jgi:phage/plasmid-like protein (TIGR03299 family)
MQEKTMAHEIQNNDGMVLVKERAWHGLGTVIPEAVGPIEAMRIAGMDWTVEESMALTATFEGDNNIPERATVETHKTLRRSDDKTILGTVGADYCVLQNAKLAEIAEALGSSGQVKVETAGTLFGGKRQFFLLRSGTVDIGKRDDEVRQYVLLANSHDGTMSATAFPTSIRVVCNNTLTAALSRSGSGVYRWKHTSGLKMRVEDIKGVLSAYGRVRDAETEAMQALAGKSMSREDIQSLWTDVLVAMDGPIAVNPKSESDKRRKEKAVSELAYMSRVFDREAKSFGANAWVAANAATHLIGHSRGYLKGEARVNANLFGGYADDKRMVMRRALELV